MKGIIYVLRNDYMHDKNGNPLYKIGLTERDSLYERLKELSRDTGVPYPFDVVDSFELENDKAKSIKEMEEWVHDCLKVFRVPSISKRSKEFFILPDVNQVRHLLKYFIKSDVNINDEDIVEDTKELVEKRTKRTAFRFHKANIKIDEIIYFVRDENIRARVVDTINKIVRIDENNNPIGEEKTYSALALEVWTSAPFNKDPSKIFPGSEAWVYNGKILPNCRTDIDNDNN